jgi:hypothetical protein
MHRNIFAAALVLILGACGNKPSQSEVRDALSKRFEGKGCATDSSLFKFPLAQKQVGYNQKIMDGVVAAGLVKKSGDTYELTELGRSAYDPAYNGFCYTDAYKIEDLKIFETEDKSSWYVSFTVAPSNVGEWVKTPLLLESAHKSLDYVTTPQKFKTVVARQPDGEIWVNGFTLSHKRGMSFSHGY